METNLLLDDIWSLTKAIERAAVCGDWTQAANLACARSPLIRMLSAQQTAVALQMIRDIQQVDSAIIDNARSAEHRLGLDYQQALRSSRYASEYQRIAQC